ncbi:hypothetical protein NMS01_003119 [Vibrio cholerae]|nr:hypothetical protein [Vibrio cholerae]
MQYKKLSDDSYLVAPDGVNIHKDHIHLASDGKTILSHKVGGQHSYKYSDTRKDLSALWEEVTGESNKFLGGWRP